MPELRLHLDPEMRASAAAGSHNFIRLMTEVLTGAGYTVTLRGNDEADRLLSAAQPGYALFHMKPTYHARTLTFRRVYHYPFWTIEQSEKRWDWRVARARFEPEQVPRKTADGFFRRWQTRLFGDAPAAAQRSGFVYVPLQGRLLVQRSFQMCSPIDMLAGVLDHDPRPVVATLHPGETYSDAELQALDRLRQRFPRLSVETGQMARWLRDCDYVVTQNSSAAFSGYFFRKPAVLFARIDFAHIAANAWDLGVDDALLAGPDLTPDFAGYVHWFWQENAINAGRPDARDRIARKFQQEGWPMRPPPD